MKFRPLGSAGRSVLRGAAAALSALHGVQSPRSEDHRERGSLASEGPPQASDADRRDARGSDDTAGSGPEQGPALGFDAAFYLAENADVREAGLDPLAHYLADGRKEGRAPNASAARRTYTMDMADLCVIDRIEPKIPVQDRDFFVSIITPTYNTDPYLLDQLKFTVLNQVYSNWEWVIVDDGSTRAQTRACVAAMAQVDDRIVVVQCERNAGISTASNLAIERARGKYIALVDHDDLLPRHALSSVYDHWRSKPDTEIFYTDECKLLPDGSLGWFWGKPDWSPAYLENTMYFGHLVVYDRDLLGRLGGFRPEVDGTQDYDLALRAALLDPKVRHVPVFGYIWRAFEGSTALDVNEKHYTLERQRRAISDYAAARHPRATVQAGEAPGYWRVRYPMPQKKPRLTYLICDADLERGAHSGAGPVAECIRALIEAAFYDEARFAVITADGSDRYKTEIQALSVHPVERLNPGPDVGSISSCLNEVAQRIDTDFFCFVDSDVRVLTERGGDEIISYMCHNPTVGIMAPVFLKQGRLWQNGTVLVRSGPARCAADQDRLFGGPNNLLRCRRETVFGGDGLFFVSAENFRKVGGFDGALPEGARELNLCLRLLQAGLTCVVDPAVEVRWHARPDDATGRHLVVDPGLGIALAGLTDPYFSKWYDQTRVDFQTRLNQYEV